MISLENGMDSMGNGVGLGITGMVVVHQKDASFFDGLLWRISIDVRKFRRDDLGRERILTCGADQKENAKEENPAPMIFNFFRHAFLS
jgi:hypothetical protein